MTADILDAVTEFDADDLCAGAGGWDVAARHLGLNLRGWEIDEAAILTREAAGYHTATVECAPTKAHPRGVRGLSMTEVDPRDYWTKPTRPLSGGRGRGLIFSPPCQGFSLAGKGEARAETARLLTLLKDVRTASDVEALIADVQSWAKHPGLWLVLEPLRWALRLGVSWLAGEQVEAVLPLWEAFAVILRRAGYSVWVGCLNAERYGVPQTRKRAIILARAPWLVAELGPVGEPVATHSKYNTRSPEKLEPGMPRWVSMAEALEWDGDDLVGFPRKADSDDVVTIDGVDYRARDLRSADRPSFGVTGKARSTIRMKGNNADRANDRSKGRTGEQPAQTVNFGHNAAAVQWETKTDSIRVSATEAAILQTFPADHPWQGTKTQVFQQIGNAIPPLLAEACLCEVLALPFRAAPPAA